MFQTLLISSLTPRKRYPSRISLSTKLSRPTFDIYTRVNAPLAKLMDWSAIQIVAMMKPAKACNPRLEEALQFLKGPDFVTTDSQLAQVKFIGPLDFSFPTPRPCDVTENNIVHGRLYRCPERWQERPVIILLHGWGDSLSYKVRFPLIACRCNGAEFNVAALVAPYHFQRRPRQRGTFESGDCPLLAQATAQAIAEIRALTGWLLGEGCPAVALWGISLGAWYAGMVACCDARLASVILTAPCARLSPWVEQRAVRPRIRRRLGNMGELCEGLNRTAMNLTSTQLVIPRENILLIEGIHDLMCPKDDIEDLWHSWGQPDIWRLPHGHVGVCCGFVPGLPERVLRWLSPRLNKPAVTY
jgi:pimeloyl-ACP methyl ester carboxylesterase